MVNYPGSVSEPIKNVYLVRNIHNGRSVVWKGRSIGWLHATVGDRWNAYFRSGDGEPAEALGAYLLEDAVRKIACKAGWPGPSTKE